jgi:hypothetical protein
MAVSPNNKIGGALIQAVSEMPEKPDVFFVVNSTKTIAYMVSTMNTKDFEVDTASKILYVEGEAVMQLTEIIRISPFN